GSTGTVLRGNYLGTDTTGSQVFGTVFSLGGDPVLGDRIGTAVLVSSSGNTLGGTAPGDRNIFGSRVVFNGPNATENVIQGNYFGVDAAGAVALRPANGGFWVQDLEFRDGASRNVVGGTTPAARNLFGYSNPDLVTGNNYPENTGG